MKKPQPDIKDKFGTVVPRSILKRLYAFVASSGMSITGVVARALDSYLKGMGA